MGWYKEHSEAHGFNDEYFKTMLDEFNLGNITEDDVIERFSKYQGITSTKEQIREELASRLHINEPLISLIQQLREKGYNTVLLTNANHIFFETYLYPKYPNFKSLFDDIIISSSIKMIKPHQDIFLYTLEKIHKNGAEILFVDDTKENVEMAQTLGIQSFVYTENDTFTTYLKDIKILP
jgi:putative hydrolase of the HAD superfamily